MRRLRFLLAYFAAWIPLAALYTLMLYLQMPNRPVSEAVYGGVSSIAAAAILGLAIWSATRRLAERGRPLASVIGVHALLALSYSIAWNAYILLSIFVFAPRPAFDSYVQFGLGWQFVTGLVVYGMVAGIAHAIAVTTRLRREREAAAKAEALRARAELSALRAQMNPHFLFNTLHSISALVRTDPRAVEDALERLAALLRRLLDVNRLGADHVALAEEWDIVRDQLELEKLRFGDRLHVVAEIESDALDCLIPIFTLQPLVENAVKHGVAARTQRCTVTIAARVRGDVLEMEVRDDGPGADKRAAMNAVGLGLRSVRQRLLAQYGDRAGVHVETSPGGGFLVRATLPAAVAPAPRHESRVPATT